MSLCYAQVFQTPQPKLEGVLADLILEGKVAARIDSRNGSLTASSQQIRTDVSAVDMIISVCRMHLECAGCNLDIYVARVLFELCVDGLY